MMNTRKTLYDIYISVIFRRGLFMLLCACISASITYTTMKIAGLYSTVPWSHIIFLDFLDIGFFVTGMLIIHNSIRSGVLRREKLRAAKVFTYCLLVIQWNYILYMIPSGTFWGLFVFFLILLCFLLDIKLLVLTGVSLVVSLVTAWKISGRNPFFTEQSLMTEDYVVSVVALGLSLVGIGIFLFFMQHIQWLYQRGEHQLQMQKKYYNKLLRKEVGALRFRHDIKKHFTAMEALCQEDDFPALKRYLRELSEQEKMHRRVYTGNSIADCFVNEMLDDLQETDGLEWEVIGKFPPDIQMNETDFCVIFGNAIENAKEELASLTDGQERKFYLTIKHYQEHLYIYMKNTASRQEEPPEGIFFSKKRGGRETGYGLQNIKLTAEKYGGTVEWELKEGMFSINIYV